MSGKDTQSSEFDIEESSARQAQLEYLADMLPQLRKLALGVEQPAIAHLLELAATEAATELDVEKHKFKVFEATNH